MGHIWSCHPHSLQLYSMFYCISGRERCPSNLWLPPKALQFMCVCRTIFFAQIFVCSNSRCISSPFHPFLGALFWVLQQIIRREGHEFCVMGRKCVETLGRIGRHKGAVMGILAAMHHLPSDLIPVPKSCHSRSRKTPRKTDSLIKREVSQWGCHISW